MGTTEVLPSVEIHRSLDIPGGDEDERPARGGRYGEMFVEQLTAKGYAIPNEGTYSVVTSPVPGTGLVTIAAPTTLTDTSPFILIQNGWSAGEQQQKRLFVDYIKLQCTAPGTGGTAIRYAIKADQASATRYTSGGTQLIPSNANMEFGNSSRAAIYAGALVATAAPQSRLLSNGLIRPVIPVIGDTYVFDFCSVTPSLGGLPPAGAAIYNAVFPVAGTVIGPQQWLAFHLFLTAQSAASSYEVEIGMWER